MELFLSILTLYVVVTYKRKLPCGSKKKPLVVVTLAMIVLYIVYIYVAASMDRHILSPTLQAISKFRNEDVSDIHTVFSGDESTTETMRDDWSPYMDVLDEETALKDTALTDVKKSVDVRFSKVYLLENGSYNVGDTARVRIDLYDGYGNRRTRGGDQLRIRIFEEALGASASGYVLDHTNGSYTAKLKCLWSGSPSILVYISYTREAIRALYHIRQTLPATRHTYVTYSNNDEKRCHAFKTSFNQSVALCNMASRNGNMSWFCEAPTSETTCSDFKSFHVKTPYPTLPITTAEETLFKRFISPSLKRNGEHLTPVINISVKEMSTVSIPKKPACISINRTLLWFQSSPIGHFINNKWEPEHCRAPSVDRIRRCLIGKHILLYGDSTLRQWFENLSKRFGCALTSKKWTNKKWKQRSSASCPSMNLSDNWIPHILPGNVDSGVGHLYENTMTKSMLKFASNKDAVFVIHLLCHLSTYHHDVFRDRMSQIRKIVDNVLKVNKDAKILIKGGHTFRDFRWVTDYYGYVYRTIVIEGFKGLYDKVVYLDNKDATIAREVIPYHPDDVIVTAMINQMLSYLCE